MPPLILHNVPDDELFVGDDGITRPYAVVFPTPDGLSGSLRMRKALPETGSFGKSTRRSRSKTATPGKREDPTKAAGELAFAEYIAGLSSQKPESPRKATLTSSTSQPNLSSQTALTTTEGNTSANRYVHKIPTEVILRGFKSTHQYAAIKQYETIAGRICEDYPRDAPLEQRRYKSDLRDPASLRTRPLSAEEKAKALKFAGGENWIKVTFESAEAAEAALYSSPQTIQGYMVYAEPYRGLPPTIENAIPATNPSRERPAYSTQTIGPNSAFSPRKDHRQTSTLPRSFTTSSITAFRLPSDSLSLSPPSSAGTLGTGTLSTITEPPAKTPTPPPTASTSIYCAKIPTARKITLLPATDALLPQPSYSQRVVAKIPLINWFGKDIIGNEVPRKEDGDFDWASATFYWRLMWILDWYFGFCGGELISNAERDD